MPTDRGGVLRSVAVEHSPEHAGHTVIVDDLADLADLVARIGGRGLESARGETYDNGVCSGSPPSP
jgi:hypothetical protein